MFDWPQSYLDPLGRNNITKECELCSENLSLLHLGIQLLASKNPKHLSQMLLVISLFSTINQNIIKVHDHKMTTERFKHLVYYPHEGTRGI